MSKVHTQEQTKVIAVNAELSPAEAVVLRDFLAAGVGPTVAYSPFGQVTSQKPLPVMLESLLAQLRQALNDKQ